MYRAANCEAFITHGAFQKPIERDGCNRLCRKGG